jgi:uncharacterized protein (TIGR03086 family)
MSEVQSRYGRVADGFGRRLAGVRDDQWSASTPCTDWDVRALVSHVIGTHERVVATVTESTPREVEPEGDLAAQWSGATASVAAALDDPALSSKVISGMFADQTFESLVGRLLCSDTLFHTWDLARATGQDDHLDPEAVERAMEFLEPIDEAIRRPGGFAPKIATSDGASAQTRFLNFGGRTGSSE